MRKVILLFAVAWVCAVGAAQGNPSIATLDPDQSLYDASLRASVTSADDGTAVWFEWGSDTNYGQAGPVVEIGTQAVVVSNAISGLTPYTTYHCQAVASNSAGVFYGGDVAFTTVPRFAQRGTNTDWTALVLSSDGQSLAGTREGVVFVSTNLGATFLPTNQVGTVFGISSDGSVVEAADGTNVYISKDSGAKWLTNTSPVGLAGLSASAYDGHLVSGIGGTVGAYTSVYISTNFGAGWTSHLLPNYGAAPTAPSADGSILYGATMIQIYSEFASYIDAQKTTDNGASWTGSALGLLSGFNPIHIACSGDAQVAAAVGGGAFTSTNGGASWAWVSSFGETFASVAVSGNGRVICESPASGDTGFLVSPDSGTTWFHANTSRWPASLCCSAEGAVFAALNGGIYLAIPSVSAALRVNIEPPAAAAAGAAWRASGSIQERGGAAVSTFTAGNHTISFAPLPGWTPPTNVTVNLVLGQTNVVTATYVQQFGSLQVDLSPPAAVTAGAKWRFDGGPAQESGTTISASVGDHTLSFTPADGWVAPSNMIVSVGNQAGIAVSATYSASASVQVLIDPPMAAAAGAGWELNSGDVEKGGVILTGLPPGSYAVSFNTISGWDSPTAFDFALTNGQMRVFTATYTEQFGGLQVNLLPAGAVAVGAAWQLDGDAYYTSGTLLRSIGVGAHRIHFLTVAGWATPPDTTVTVSQSETNILNQAYVPAGSLQVNLLPMAAVASGAHWRVDGGALQDSGATVGNLAVGDHTVSFSFARGWTTPPGQSLSISSNALSVLTGTYPPAMVVTNTDQQTLRNVLAFGGTVDLAINGTILLTNPIVVSNDLVLDGTGYNAVLSGGSNTQIFVVETNATLSLIHLTLIDGLALSPSNGFLDAPTFGGAISNGGSVLATECLFASNAAVARHGDAYAAVSAEGGAIYNVGNLVISNSTFLENRSLGANGILQNLGFGFVAGSGGEGDGGAIYNGGEAIICGSTFSSNTAAGGVGAGGVFGSGVGGAANGGALCNAGTLALTQSTFSTNGAVGGAGGTGLTGQPNYYGASGGYPGANGGAGGNGHGGALSCVSGTAIVVNSTFSRNSAVGGGGGGGGNGGSISVGRGQASNGGNGANGADGIGGAVCVIGGTALITNITCVRNASMAGIAGAPGPGGGGGQGGNPGYPGLPGTSGAALGASVAGTNGGALAVANSILDCAGKQTNAYGTIIDGGYNLNSDASGFFTNSTSLNGVDPMLGALGNYGGPTETIPLLPGSPAINAADPVPFPATDQRGFARPSGAGPDIGAFEYTFVNLAALALTNGAVQFDLQGEWSNTVVIEVSSDLEHWAALGTNTVSSNGVKTISDPNASSGARFYRAVKE